MDRRTPCLSHKSPDAIWHLGRGYATSVSQLQRSRVMGVKPDRTTPDEYLWLATEFGLLRFDGVRAVAWEPPRGQSLPSKNIRKLFAADGRNALDRPASIPSTAIVCTEELPVKATLRRGKAALTGSRRGLPTVVWMKVNGASLPWDVWT